MIKLLEQYGKEYPKELAIFLDQYSPEVVLQLLNTSPELKTSLIKHLSPQLTILCIEQLEDSTEFGNFIQALDLNMVALVSRKLNKKIINKIINLYPKSKKDLLSELISYEVNQIGYFTEYHDFTIQKSLTIKDLIKSINTTSSNSPIFIIDENSKYYGRVDFREIVKNLQNIESSVELIASKNSTKVNAITTLTSITNLSTWQTDQIIPVVGKNQVFLGIVRSSKIKQHLARSQTQTEQDPTVSNILETSEFAFLQLGKLLGALK